MVETSQTTFRLRPNQLPNEAKDKVSRKQNSDPGTALRKQLIDQLIEAYLLLIYNVNDNMAQLNEFGESQHDLSGILESVLEILEDRGLITRPENRLNLTKNGKLAAELFLTLKNNVFFNDNTITNWWDEKTRFIKSFPPGPKTTSRERR